MIEIKNLTKTFDSVVASNRLSLTIDKGIYGLVGENGAGKSTLFRLISNVIHQDAGEILIDGIPNTEKEAKEKIFFLPDNPYIKPFQPIPAILNFYKSFYEIDEKRFYSLIKSFDLPIDRRVDGFSKGMKRQLFIAIALSIKTKYLLLDEAFDGLDPLVMHKIKEMILYKRDEDQPTIIIASHNINSLNQIADKILLLCKGTLAKEETIEDMAFEMVKYQVAFRDHELTEKEIIALGFDLINMKKVGSIYYVVLKNNPSFKEKMIEIYHPLIIEEIPLDAEEIITMDMMSARKEIRYE